MPDAKTAVPDLNSYVTPVAFVSGSITISGKTIIERLEVDSKLLLKTLELVKPSEKYVPLKYDGETSIETSYGIAGAENGTKAVGVIPVGSSNPEAIQPLFSSPV